MTKEMTQKEELQQLRLENQELRINQELMNELTHRVAMFRLANQTLTELRYLNDQLTAIIGGVNKILERLESKSEKKIEKVEK